MTWSLRLAAAAVAGTLAHGAGAAVADEPGRAFLAHTFGLTPAELTRIDDGRVVARSLGAADDREVATLGLVRVAIPAPFYASQIADIVAFKRGDGVPQVGVFGEPARPTDLGGLVLERAEVRALRACRPGDCAVQLPESLMSSLRAEVAWDTPAAEAEALRVLREGLARHVARYRTAGAAALMSYDDTQPPVAVAAEFQQLAESDERVLRRFPDVLRHLLQFPQPAGLPVRDVIYWSREKMGRVPVLSISHLAITRPAGVPEAQYVIASKQIYGSHYYDASLGLTLLVTAGDAATYVAYLNRSRVDAFHGLLGAVTRKAVRIRTTSGTADHLQRLKARLEREYAAAALQ